MLLNKEAPIPSYVFHSKLARAPLTSKHVPKATSYIIYGTLLTRQDVCILLLHPAALDNWKEGRKEESHPIPALKAEEGKLPVKEGRRSLEQLRNKTTGFQGSTLAVLSKNSTF